MAKTIDPTRVLTVAGAAKRIGRPYSTIRRAIERRELVPIETADGAELLPIEAVDAWDAEERKPGPKAQKAKG